MSTTPSIEEQHIEAAGRFHQAQARAHGELGEALLGLVGQVELEETPIIRGSLQRRILGLPELAALRGMTSREVAAATNGDEPNCHTALKALVTKDIVEVVEGSSPQQFRLAVSHRRNRVVRLSRLIEAGEWTTYGDFSIAVYDNVNMALPVARVAAHHPAFASPHRLLQAKGSVSEGWHDEQGNPDPEECKRRLREEHVWDDATDSAQPDKRIGWEELQTRLTEDEASDEDIAA